MPVTLSSISNVGSKTGNMVATFTVQVGPTDPGPANLQTPFYLFELQGFSGNQFEINIDSYVSSSLFGSIKRLRMVSTKPQSYWVSNANMYQVGRTVVYIPSTGECVMFAPKRTNSVGLQLSTIGHIPTYKDVDNLLIDVSSISPPIFRVIFDVDQQDGAIEVPKSALIISAYNF